MGTDTVNILGVTGSLRKGSYNTAALRAAAEMAADDVNIRSHHLAGIPPYDDDLRLQGYPGPVQAFRDAIAEADAVLIATPEYNYSIPGVLKNAIDWASRPPQQPFEDKPVAIMGASPGRLGTARAQYHLRQVFVFLNAMVLNRPEVMIGGAAQLFDGDGRLSDETTREHIGKLVEALAAFTRRLRA